MAVDRVVGRVMEEIRSERDRAERDDDGPPPEPASEDRADQHQARQGESESGRGRSDLIRPGEARPFRACQRGQPVTEAEERAEHDRLADAVLVERPVVGRRRPDARDRGDVSAEVPRGRLRHRVVVIEEDRRQVDVVAECVRSDRPGAEVGEVGAVDPGKRRPTEDQCDRGRREPHLAV